MEIHKIARYEIRPQSLPEVLEAIETFAAYVRDELTETRWTTLQDPAHPTRFVSLIWALDEAADQRHRQAEGTQRFVAALYPNVVGEVDFTSYRLVADSGRPA